MSEIKVDVSGPQVSEIEKVHAAAEGERAYTKSFTTFSGADMIVLLNGRPIGEIQRIEFEESLAFGVRKFRINGTITAALFDRDSKIKSILKKSSKPRLAIFFANEYGQQSYARFKNPAFTRRFVDFGIDTICPEERYEFAAEDFEMKSGFYTLEHGGSKELIIKVKKTDAPVIQLGTLTEEK